MTRSPHRTAVLLAAVSTVALSSSAWSQVAQAASMNFTSFVDGNCGTVTNTGSDAWGVVLSGLNVSANASTTDCNGGSLSAFGTGFASWASAAAGNVTFRGVGFTFDNAAGTATDNSGTDWKYTFLATGNGTFTMNGTVTGAGNTFGLWGWAVGLSGGPEGSQTGGVQNAFDPSSSWTFTGSVTAGNTYDVFLTNNANINLKVPGSLSGNMAGVFDWQINTAPVVTTPEPTTLALIFPGLLIAGAAARRRNRK